MDARQRFVFVAVSTESQVFPPMSQDIIVRLSINAAIISLILMPVRLARP